MATFLDHDIGQHDIEQGHRWDLHEVLLAESHWQQPVPLLLVGLLPQRSKSSQDCTFLCKKLASVPALGPGNLAGSERVVGNLHAGTEMQLYLGRTHR